MEFRSGTYRLVLIIPSSRIVIKIPRIRFIGFIQLVDSHMYTLVKGTGSWKIFWKHVFLNSSDKYLSGRRELFKGLIDNWREWQFWKETHYPVLAPTFFWFAGCTIQRYANPLKIQSGIKLFDYLKPILGDEIRRDGHHFMNPDNFGELNGHFVVADYAGLTMQSLLRRYGDTLVREFDLSIT
jgi:hypothetical protein